MKDLIEKSALLLGVPTSWLKERTIQVAHLDGSDAHWVLLGTERKTPFLAVVYSTAEKTGMSLAERAFAKDRLVGLCVVATKPFAGWTAYRRNFATNRAEEVPRFQLVATPKSDAESSGLNPLDHRFESMLFEAHSMLRDMDGLHPDEALDELCKVLDAKLEDELQLTEPRAFFRGNASVEEFAAEVRRIALRSHESQSTIRLSSAALSAIASTFSDWSLKDSPLDVKGRAFQRLLGTTFRAGLGQYFTPSPIVNLLVDSVAPEAREKVIDPFCGSGHFLIRALESFQATGSKTGPELWGMDINERMLRIAATDMRLHGDGRASLQRSNSLLPFSNLQAERSSFDVVLTNPPFGSVMTSDSLSQLGPFSLARGASTPLEIVGLERSVELLKPGGRIAIVLPEGVLTNKRLAHVREWIYQRLRVRCIISFPREAFAPLGANIATCAIIGTRRTRAETAKLNEKVLLLDIGDIGYDASGRPTSSTDMQRASDEFTRFIKKEGW